MYETVRVRVRVTKRNESLLLLKCVRPPPLSLPLSLPLSPSLARPGGKHVLAEGDDVRLPVQSLPNMPLRRKLIVQLQRLHSKRQVGQGIGLGLGLGLRSLYSKLTDSDGL